MLLVSEKKVGNFLQWYFHVLNIIIIRKGEKKKNMPGTLLKRKKNKRQKKSDFPISKRRLNLRK
jgi:hypothetical protein